MFYYSFLLANYRPQDMICRSTKHSQLQLKTTGAMLENMKYHPVLKQFSKQFLKTNLIGIINLSPIHGNSWLQNFWSLIMVFQYICVPWQWQEMAIHCQQIRAWLTRVISLQPHEHQYVIILKHYSIYNILIIYKQESKSKLCPKHLIISIKRETRL